MMAIGPKTGLAANPLEIGPVDGAAPAGAGEMFLQIMADAAQPLTLEEGGKAPLEVPADAEMQETLTIKTFHKLLDAKSGDGEPEKAPGEDALSNEGAGLTVGQAEVLAPSWTTAPMPSPPPTIAAIGGQPPATVANAEASQPQAVASNGVFTAPASVTPQAEIAEAIASPEAGIAQTIRSPETASVPAPGTPVSETSVGQPAAANPLAQTPKPAREALPIAQVRAALRGASAPVAIASGSTDAASADAVSPRVPGAATDQQPGAKLAMPAPAVGKARGSIEAASPKTPSLEPKDAPVAGAETPASADPVPAEAHPAPPAPANASILGIFSTLVQLAPAEQAAPAATAPATGQPGEVQDAMVEQHLDLAHEGEWLDRLARDIARSSGTEGSLRFRLNPEHLGSLHVELNQGAAGASLRLTAETEAARAIIADAQPRLVAEARAQGVRLAETHVDLGANSHSAAGEQRRQGEERPQSWVRTAGGRATEAGDPPPQSTTLSERYA